MSSGIAISPQFDETMDLLSKRQCSAIVLKINAQNTLVEVERTWKPKNDNPAQDWKDFSKTIPENESRFIVADFQVKESPTVTKSRIVLLAWAPDTAPIKTKMVYAATKESLSNHAAKVQKNIQVTDLDEFSYNALKGKVFM